jgi:hypothetical protein
MFTAGDGFFEALRRHEDGPQPEIGFCETKGSAREKDLSYKQLRG